MNKKILITSALPYANGPLHFGHIAGAYLPADCYARFERLMDNRVLFICGSDEYGVAITLNAEMEGRTPKEHVDIYNEVIKNFFDQLNMSFDHYSRTTWEGHKEPVQRVFLDLLKNNFIEKRETDQLYSEKDKKFLADRYVVGTCPRCGFENARGDECQRCGASYDAVDLINPKSKLTGSSLAKKPTTHWFLLLDKFKERLTEWLDQKNWKPNVMNFARQYIKELHPRAITRDFTWGVPVPLEEAKNKVLYVWFDAPIGYITSTMEWAQKENDRDAWRDWWCDPETKLVQFLGKDNIPFHAVIFPAMTMGQDTPYKLVDELAANEFYNLEGKRFSKSDNWFIDLNEFFKNYSADQIRYTIAVNAPETGDSEFTWKDFQMRCNSELLGKYGNFANRTLVFAIKSLEGKVPRKGLEEQPFYDAMEKIVDECQMAYQHFKLRHAAKLIMDLATLGNVFFDQKKPWLLAKDETKHDELQTTIYACLECLKRLAVISYPIIPQTAEKLYAFLGFDEPIASSIWAVAIANPLPEGQLLRQPTLLFTRIEDAQIAQEESKLKKS